MKTKKSEIFFVIIIAIICIILWVIPTGFENPGVMINKKIKKTKVIDVKNHLEYHGLVVVGSQELLLEVQKENVKNDTIQANNILMGQKSMDKIFKKGDYALTVYEIDRKTGRIIEARADDLYRLDIEIILFVIYGLFLVLFAGWTGLKALLSFIFTVLAIWKLLIPLYLNGQDPVIISLIVVLLAAFVIILLVAGFTKKGLIALLGATAGILLTAILSFIFGYFFNIPGTVREFSEMLLYSGFGHLNLSKIFLSGIFISSAGAVMDIAMDIAASQNEIVQKKPEIRSKELILSGFNISRTIIGTMTTTLLFAYSGSFSFLFMIFMSKGIPVESIFNMNIIAAEVLQTLVGSFGLLLVAPATSIIGGYILVRKKKESIR